jgi:hypothetical protein
MGLVFGSLPQVDVKPLLAQTSRRLGSIGQALHGRTTKKRRRKLKAHGGEDY